LRGFRTFPSKRVDADGVAETQEDLAIESILEILLGNEFLAAFVCTPGLESELALGYLLSSGIVSSAADIKDIVVKNMRAKVTLHEGVTIDTDKGFSQNRRFMSTECSAPEMLIELRTGGRIPEVQSHLKIQLAEIAEVSEKLREGQDIHKKTRGTHAALVRDTLTNRSFIAEDIGRRNAVDKVIGLAVKAGADLSMSYLFSTGRLTADVVSKCAWTSIPLIASFAVTTDAGLKFAQRANVTLIGFVRGQTCMIYHEGAAKIIL